MKMPLFPPEHRPRFVCLLLVLAAGIFFIARAHNGKLSDYGNYYYGSKFLREGKMSTDVYDTWKFNRMIEQEGGQGLFENYTPVPPFTAFVVVPFTYFSPHTSKTIFNCCSLLLFLFVLNIFLRQQKSDPYFYALPLLLLVPLKSNMDAGQLYLLLFSLLAGGFLLGEKKKYIPAALCYALAIHLKLFPAIFLLFFLFTRQFRLAGWTMLGVFLLLAVAHLGIPGDVLHGYFREILPRLMNNEINDPFATSYQSVAVFLRQLLVRDQLLNPGALSDVPLVYMVLLGFYSAVLVVTAISVSVARTYTTLVKWGMWMLVMLMVSGYGASYALVLLLFPVVAVLSGMEVKGRNVLLVLLPAVLISAVPAGYFAELNVLLRFPRLWLLLTFFFVVIILLRPRLQWKYLLVAGMYPLLLFMLRHADKEQSHYFFTKEEAMLTGYYVQLDQELVLSCFDRSGYEVKRIPVSGELMRSSSLSCDGHRVKKDGKIIFESNARIAMPSWKGDSLLFLSDKDRGVGMYTLRYIRSADYPRHR